MKHNDVYTLVQKKVGLKEDLEYKKLFNPKDLYGASLEPLSIRNFKRFVAINYYLIVEQKNKFDLIVGPGDSGLALTKLTELVYRNCNITPSQILNLPITRFKYGFDLYDNSILIPEVRKELKDLKRIESILVVDDEIAHGVTLEAAIKLILSSLEPGIVTTKLKVTLVAEDQDFKTENFMDNVEIEMYPFAKDIKGMFTVIRYIVPWTIEQKIREHFTDEQVGSKSLINLLLDLPIKETEMVKGVKLQKAKFTFKERDLLKKEIPNFEKLQKEFKRNLDTWIKEAISEYKNN